MRREKNFAHRKGELGFDLGTSVERGKEKGRMENHISRIIDPPKRTNRL